MNTNESLYLTLLDIARKDSRGRGFSVGQFNRALSLVSADYFNKVYDEFARTKLVVDSLLPFKREYTGTIASGKVVLPTEFYHIIGNPYCTDGQTQSANSSILLVNEVELIDRLNDSIIAPTTHEPVCVERWDATNSYVELYFEPASGFAVNEKVTVQYLKQPSTPFLDYYIDSNKVAHYLAEKENHTVASGEVFPLGTNPGVGNTYTSQTVELEWGMQDRPVILYMLLQYFSVSVNDQVLAQYGIAKSVGLENVKQ